MRSVLSHLKVGFDLDGVLAHSEIAAVSWYQRHGLLHSEATAADMTSYDHSECFDKITHDDMSRMFRDPDFFADILPDWGAVELVRDLYHAGTIIHIVTHRDWRPEDRITTSGWLAKYGVPYTRLEFRTPYEKPHYAERWELDYFVEDHPKTAVFIAAKPNIRASFIRDKPYNKNTADHPKLVRFYRWNELREFFHL